MDSREDERPVRFDAVGARASSRVFPLRFRGSRAKRIKGERENSEKK